ncbi:glutathione synthase/RimK-type ligase-like ATP-grasp enzyme [Streptacidiphilus sp. MAP12-16]|uniref:ATP-grasp domain-containing protein n=1 Tax=Streptacidiphilus sp. MAP12-16 TaxID=3156300 RepID=UPI0035114F3D
MFQTGRVILATSTVGLDKDVDLPLMVDALRARGVDAAAVRWDAADYDWSACERVIIRSTWDYADRLDEYLSWVDRVSAVTRLHNPAEVVRWSSDKRYLQDLADQGVPTAPTTFIAPGDDVALPANGQFVVKPTVSAGARGAARYTGDQVALAARHVRSLNAAGATAMVQPYLSRIAEGERALVFLGGSFSHATRKGPVLTDIGVVDNARVAHPDLVGHQPSAAEIELATAALRVAPSRDEVRVARVDVALADDGSPVVMELELIEPNLFLTHNPAGLRSFADMVQGL